MTKVQEAIEVLQNMPAEKARMFADAIIDAAMPRAEDMQLSDDQVAEIQRRIAVPNPKFITLAEAQARLQKIGV